MTDSDVVPGMLEQLHALYRRCGEIDDISHADQRTILAAAKEIERLERALADRINEKCPQCGTKWVAREL